MRLATHYDLEVLTTCARDYRTWRNEYPSGVAQSGGFVIRRFAVDRPREQKKFDRLSREIRDHARTLSLAEQDEWQRLQGPFSSAMLRHLEVESYAAVLFLPYLYAPTYFGLPLVAKRSILVPLAHDEWPIFMPGWNKIFGGAGAIVYMNAAERTFVSELFAHLDVDGPVIAPGIEAHAGDAQRFRKRFDLAEPFALYLGRVDESKGCLALANDFERHRGNHDYPASLVLAGPNYTSLQSADGIRVVGPLDEQTKWDALHACDLFVMPSPHESFSFALLEAWSCGKPAIVNAKAAVLVEHCRASNGGLWYRNAQELSAVICALNSAVGPKLGQQGARYVRARFQWEESIGNLERIIDAIASGGGDLR
jgi:glycosyltransferase involved in cell wall biosynthesis